MTIPSQPTEPLAEPPPPAPLPSARRLRRDIRRARRDHSDRSIWQSIEQVYVGLFALGIFGAMAGGVLSQVWSEVSQCSGEGCALARQTLPPALALAVLGLAVRTLLSIGPIVASRATATWLLDSPLDRRVLLTRPFGVLLLGAAVGGLVVLGGSVGLSVGHRSVSVAGIGVWLGVVIGLALAAGTALAQPSRWARRVLTACGDLLILAGCALAAVVVLGGSVPSTAWARSGILEPVAVAATALAVILGVIAQRRLSRLPRHRVVAGGDLLSGLSGAAVSLDISFVSDLLVARRFRVLGARKTRRGGGQAGLAIGLREAMRWTRTPRLFIVPLVLLLVPYVVAWSGLPSAIPVGVAIVGYIACRPLAGGLHTVSRSKGLRRAFPLEDTELRFALVLPAWVAGGVWVAATLPAIPADLRDPIGWLALTAIIAAGVVRSATREPPSFDGPLISSPMGALPSGFVGSLVRGPDMVVIGLIPVIFGLPGVIMVGLPLALVAFGIFRGSKKLTEEANKQRQQRQESGQRK